MKKITIFLSILLFINYGCTNGEGPIIQKQSIFDWIRAPGSFSILLQLLAETRTDANVNKLLDQRTLFAPTDNAFKQFCRLGLLDGSQNSVENKKKFTNFLIVAKLIQANELENPAAKFPTMSGNQISVSQIGKVFYGHKTENGKIYVIDTVPVDPDLEKIIYPSGKPDRK